MNFLHTQFSLSFWPEESESDRYSAKHLVYNLSALSHHLHIHAYINMSALLTYVCIDLRMSMYICKQSH